MKLRSYRIKMGSKVSNKVIFINFINKKNGFLGQMKIYLFIYESKTTKIEFIIN